MACHGASSGCLSSISLSRNYGLSRRIVVRGAFGDIPGQREREQTCACSLSAHARTGERCALFEHVRVDFRVIREGGGGVYLDEIVGRVTRRRIAYARDRVMDDLVVITHV